ncbi:lysosome membrane protein 2-like isoform X2 [Babylonia areolata]|uniref:lysosome membrane protein 2-like isoform X2 n=1 Tax=Babylonia areolata TaxID=304850 RepID=UPI003FD39553
MVNCTKGRCCKWGFCITGLVLLVTGCVLIKVFDTLIHDKVDDSLPLKEGSTSYKNWMEPPAPIYFQVWMQHVANADEVVQQGAKPVLEQMGPYTYREKREKINITFDDNNTTISYRERQWYFFDRNASVGPETDNFTTVSLPMLTIVNLVRFEYFWVKDLLDFLLSKTNEHLFVNLSVEELMWGYEDNLLKEAKAIFDRFHLPFPLDDKFGLFYQKNGSDDGVYKIMSGMGGTIDQFAEIISWNGNTSLSFWNSSIANSLNGSDGTLYPPFVDKSQALYLFSSDLCRSLEIQYSKEYGLKGIDVYRFIVPPMTFANVSVNPDNEGFCTPSTNCLPAGLLNASVCRDGAPVILSLPHFLDGDPDVRNRVFGMNPNRTEHQSVIDIEPMTGVVMNAAKRLQLNAYLNKTADIKDLEKLSDYVVLPILWLSESATIDDKSAKDFKSEVLLAVKVTEAVQYGLIALGVFLLICWIIVILRDVFTSSRDKEMTAMGDTERMITA